MEDEIIKIIQDVTNANYVYVVRDLRHRDVISMYSRKWMLRELRNATWRVQLMEPDGTFNPDSRVFYEGNDAEEVLRQVEPSWGVWSLLEIEDGDDEAVQYVKSIFFVGTEPRQYIISLNEIL